MFAHPRTAVLVPNTVHEKAADFHAVLLALDLTQHRTIMLHDAAERSRKLCCGATEMPCELSFYGELA